MSEGELGKTELMRLLIAEDKNKIRALALALGTERQAVKEMIGDLSQALPPALESRGFDPAALFAAVWLQAWFYLRAISGGFREELRRVLQKAANGRRETSAGAS